MAEGKDLARSALPLRGDRRQPTLPQHGRNPPSDSRRHRGVALHEVGEAREDDRPHDAFGERVSPGGRGARRRHAGPLLALLRRELSPGEPAETRRHAIDRALRVMIENAFQPLPALGHGRERPRPELDVLALPGHPPGRFEREIGAGFHEHRHVPVPRLPGSVRLPR